MKRILAWAVVALLLAGSVLAIYVYQMVVSLEAERITDDVHALFGLGGNVGVLRTERGAAIVDTMTFRMQGEEIRERVEAITGREVEVILNTHYHGDHTHGNPAFPAGLRVVSTARTLELLRVLDGEYFSGAAAATLPNETFSAEHEIRLGGKTIRSIHPGRGHTDGDQVVLFVEDRVIHMGDLFSNQRYPNIDLEAGGSVRAWADTLDRVLALDFDHVIPGHGPLTDRAGLEQFQRFLRELWREAEAAAQAGKSLEETLSAVKLTEDAGYQAIVIPGIVRLDRDFVVRRAWEEATGAVTGRVDAGGGAVAAGG
jgi:glyoxylase-like metal-dependent hydrolase (beta-lactamase superfamily II)